MKTQIVTFAILILAAVSVKAQKSDNLFYNGYTYYENAKGEQIMIPFATVKIYETGKADKVLAIRLTALNGYYEIKNIDVEKSYTVVVTADKLKEQKFKLVPNNGRVKKYNISVNLQLIVPENYNAQHINPQIFKPDEFGKTKKLTVDEMISKLPMINKNDNELTSKDGGTVKLFVNGIQMKSKVYKRIKKHAAVKIVKQMEYFDLSKTGNPIFDGGLNILLVAGQVASKPNYKLISRKRVEN